MATLMPTDTAAALGRNAEKCDSRSLLLDRFADPTAKESERKSVFTRAFAKNPDSNKSASWTSFLIEGLSLQIDAILYAQLQSRLMINMAGGVMDNAGLCLDRFGMPYVPGSAVKGCARRMAIEELREASHENRPVAQLAALLAAIARVFGWGETEWKDGRKRAKGGIAGDLHSDFEFACGEGDSWKQVRPLAANLLVDALQVSRRVCQDEPWRDLPSFAGSVSFLPAYPVDLGKTSKVAGLPLDVPELGKLELDVVTCHHRDYYAEPDSKKKPREWEEWNRKWGPAPDTEEPIPVVFPAVAPGHVFAFALAKVRGCSDDDLVRANAWLASGLQTFGLGAKTNAGYGWFNSSDSVQQIVGSFIKKAGEERRVKQAQAEADRKRAEAKGAAERAEEERLAKAAPYERFQAEYAKLADEPFAAQAKKLAEMTDDQRHGFILALKDKRETTKRWAKRKPELLKPWQEYAQKLQPPIQLP